MHNNQHKQLPLLTRRQWVPGILLLVTAAAAFLRFWRLDAIPPGFHYDEAYEALEAWRMLTQPGYHPLFFPGNFGVEPMFIYLTTLAFRLFGETPTVMRGVAALVGTLTVPALYALGRELAHQDEHIKPGMPLLAAAALATMRWHITFSRVGIEPVLVPLLLVLLLWAFWRALRTGSLWAWAGVGLAAGFGPYTYPAGRLLPILAVLLAGLALWWAWRGHHPGQITANPLRGLVVACSVGLLIFAPLALHWMQNPDQLFLRSSQIMVGSNDTVAGTPAQNLLATLGMFSLRGDMDPRNNAPGVPVLDWLLSIPFLLGIGLSARHAQRPVFVTWWLALALMLIPTMFSEYTPHFRRALGASPLVALVCGWGLALLLGWPGWRLANTASATRVRPVRLWSLGRLLAVIAILVGSTTHSIRTYFDVWGHSPALYYAYDQGLWEIGQYMLELPAEEHAYVTPRPAADMTLAFAWRAGRPVRHFDGRHAFIAQAGDSIAATYVVIEHEDFRGAHVLQALYPSATIVQTFLDRKGQVYAHAYRVPAGVTPARSPQYLQVAQWPGLMLTGFDLDRPSYQAGAVMYLQLWWEATAAIPTDWTVFTHLLGPMRTDGSIIWVGRDAQPGQGSVPTTTWTAGDLILDEYQLQIPPDAPPGDYQIEVGLYNLAAGGARNVLTMPAGQDHVILKAVKIE